MSDSQASLAGVIEKTSANLNAISTRLKTGTASAEELMECGKLVFALAEALKIYAEKMPEADPSSRHSLRHQPPAT